LLLCACAGQCASDKGPHRSTRTDEGHRGAILLGSMMMAMVAAAAGQHFLV